MRRYIILTDDEIKNLLMCGTVTAMFNDKVPIHIMNQEAWDHESFRKFDDDVEKTEGGY